MEGWLVLYTQNIVERRKSRCVSVPVSVEGREGRHEAAGQDGPHGQFKDGSPCWTLQVEGSLPSPPRGKDCPVTAGREWAITGAAASR
ncbi:hypothetical protein E2C01_058406 [Portunus trituberculatus]|uniref:Uncharacterized protein n=1 Tax=Portunus trituberculatus TaxID=210409 RepID=A0A5B7H612_PORTR|nr:hypothetical protein [Portunus trituberculatus]